MIDLVRELRKRAPSDAKPGLKLANPEMMSDVIDWYNQSNDVVVKALVKELCLHAGAEWLERLSQGVSSDSAQGELTHTREKRFITRTYRGQTSLIEAPSQQESRQKQTVQRVYRGCAIK